MKKTICVIDGQGGGIGATLIQSIKEFFGESAEVIALRTNAYYLENDEVTLIMESVVIVEPDGVGRWHIVGTFGDRKTVKGRIRRMTLVKKWILFEPEPEPHS